MHLFNFDRLFAYSCSLFLFLLLCNCSQEEPLPLNEVTPNDDVAIGYSIDEAFLHHLDTVPDEQLLSDSDYPDIYLYLHQMCSKIQATNAHALQSDQSKPLRIPIVRILEGPNKTTAFVAPGGHIYIYTDLLKSLNHEAELIPILAHLLNCSMNRFDVKKLEEHFSTNFLLDLAIGSNVGASYASPATNVCAIIDQLSIEPYKESDVAFLDEKAEDIACNLGYDIEAYSDLYSRHTNSQGTTQHLNWFKLFPRSLSHSAYAAYLSNTVKDSLTCGGTITTAGYADFKTLIP